MANNDLLQLFHPGMPELRAPWTGGYEIVWSIYIRCGNKPKLHRVHIPALEAIIGQPHGGRGWVVETEKDTPGEMRLMTVEPLAGPYSGPMLLSLLKRLYALRPNWLISARLKEENPRGVYVCARFVERGHGSVAPPFPTSWWSCSRISRP